MKKLSLLAIFAMGTTILSAGTLTPNKTLDVQLASYCNKFHLVINETAGTVTGEHYGCGYTQDVSGYVGSNSKKGTGLTLMAIDNGTQTPFMVFFDDVPKNYILTRTGGSVGVNTWSKIAPSMEEVSGLPDATSQE